MHTAESARAPYFSMRACLASDGVWVPDGLHHCAHSQDTAIVRLGFFLLLALGLQVAVVRIGGALFAPVLPPVPKRSLVPTNCASQLHRIPIRQTRRTYSSSSYFFTTLGRLIEYFTLLTLSFLALADGKIIIISFFTSFSTLTSAFLGTPGSGSRARFASLLEAIKVGSGRYALDTAVCFGVPLRLGSGAEGVGSGVGIVDAPLMHRIIVLPGGAMLPNPLLIELSVNAAAVKGVPYFMLSASNTLLAGQAQVGPIQRALQTGQLFHIPEGLGWGAMRAGALAGT